MLRLNSRPASASLARQLVFSCFTTLTSGSSSQHPKFPPFLSSHGGTSGLLWWFILLPGPPWLLSGSSLALAPPGPSMVLPGPSWSFLVPSWSSLVLLGLSLWYHSFSLGQVKEFEEYGVRSIAINHDTPHDKTLWSHVSKGSFHNLLVAPEQFFPEGGHIPRLALQLNDQSFINRIGFFFIDEAHFISTAGEAQAGEKIPFHAAYSKLAEVLIQLPIDVPVALFSATLPQLILQRIENSLKLSSDATRQDHANYQSNLDFLMPIPLHPAMAYPPKSLIFIDHKLSTAAVTKYLNACLPGAGINVIDIHLVVQFGITINISEHEQRAGRGGRDHMACIVLMIVEKWAYKDQNVDITPSGGSKSTMKEKRTDSAMLQFVNTSTCRRQFLAEYNNDTTVEALDYDSMFCCDQHADQAFNLNHWLPGETLPSILAQSCLDISMNVDERAPLKKVRKRYRPVVQRMPLEELLKAWHETVSSNKPDIKGWPSDWILADQHIIKLT
ncbi:uncharacterized protein F5891DRAFT_1190964 [Suillus fuscotomentosus]|uniref:DNA 3'-5' helicase n=1 Tax=Suillus fuscotomentosus TaxID=1912939 RepID=A0AAD4E2F1_9AGAM|nr:uncharacterized protein F5891DRAFT_1190964 [Suillus fuscotomentosus]KAG1898295.1 hypothetical protein F5891DRAFT_1190964 [Suillus fuscotomentosus]